jgi:hypothetical protein
MPHGRVGWRAEVVIALLAIGCKPDSVAPMPTPATESRPEGIGRVVKVEPNDPIGLRLDLATGVVLTVGPPGSQILVQTTTGPDSLAIYGHDRRGLWVLWLGLDPKHGPGCFALPKIGYDRQELIAWPGDGFALPKAATFRVEPGGDHRERRHGSGRLVLDGWARAPGYLLCLVERRGRLGRSVTAW